MAPPVTGPKTPTDALAPTPATITSAEASTIATPTKAEALTPVSVALAAAATVTEPAAAAPATPVTNTLDSATTVTLPVCPVAARPVTGTEASAMTSTVPTCADAATPSGRTSVRGSPHEPRDQGPEPQPTYSFELAIGYAIRMIAAAALAVGNTIVKSPAVDVLSTPKSNTATAGLPAADEL